ncbi:MAG: sigma-70 family RNA polymerase sigma factor [Polyangiaceae bacterium]
MTAGSSLLAATSLEARATTQVSVQEVIRAHGPYVGRSLRYLGVSEADLDDVAQEVFLVVHRRLGDFEGRSSLRTWLYGICLKVASSHRRRVERRREAGLGEAPEEPVSGGQQSALERAEARRRMQRVLADLDEEQREVFVLYEIERVAMKDVAELLGCPLQTAYYRHQTARKKVIAAFEHMAAEEEL